MKKTITVLGIATILLFSCTEKQNPVSPENKEKKIEINGVWVYRYQLINLGINDFPDTLVFYSKSKCYGDTTIRGSRYYSFFEDFYDVDFLSIDTSRYHFYVRCGADSVNVLVRDISGPSIGIGRSSAIARNRLVDKNCLPSVRLFNHALGLKTSGFRGIFQSKEIADGFADCYYPVVYPLQPGKEWFYRPEGDPNGNLPIKRKCLGQELVTVQSTKFSAWRLEWDWSLTPFFEGLIGFDWWTDFGIIKRYFDFGVLESNEINQESEVIKDTIHPFQIFEYVGEDSTKIPPLRPYLLPETISYAKNIVAQSWQYDRFRQWFDTLVSYCSDKPEYQEELTRFHEEVKYFITFVWGDTTISFQSQAAYLNSHLLPSQEKEFFSFNDFLTDVIGSFCFVQGWSDCSYDWSKSARPFSETQFFKIFPGRSKIRKELDEYFYSHINSNQ